LIRAERASLVYRDHGREVHACRDVDLEIRSGEFVGILGPSGSGKSSLLYLLSGLKTPTCGSVRYHERVLSALSDVERSELRLREFGFVFQQPYLLGYLNALENVVVSSSNGGRRAKAESLIEALGLSAKAHRLPHELSVGERQRVCVARALLGGPKVVFADEPTAALDHATGVRVVDMLREHRGKGALVIVTHDPSMLESAERILEISEGGVAERALP
jgi:putative ABC transport system ATP-binding protein